MNFYDLSTSRRSIRSFKQENVPDEVILSLIRSAAYAPSAGNCQPWHFCIIRDEEVKQKIAIETCGQSFISTAPIIIVVCAEAERSAKRYGERGRSLYCIQDTAAAIQNILLHAADIGLGGCWCGAFDENKLSEILNLTAERRPIAVIPIGYPNGQASAPKRRPLDEMITFIGESPAEQQAEDNVKNAKFEHSNLSDAVFYDVNLSGSSFSNVNLYSADISDANFTDGKIHDCNLSNMKIYDCCINGMTVNGIEISKLSRS